MAGIDNAFLLFDIAFGVVVLSLVLQGTTIPIMANLFKVRIPSNDEPKEKHKVWVSDNASITLYEFEVNAGAFAIGRHPKSVSNRVSPDEINIFALVRAQKIVVVDKNTQLQFGDNVWYAMRGDYASQIAKVFNDTAIDRKKIDDFYGNWLLSPSVQLGDLPFFAKAMQTDTKTAMWRQTVAEYVKSNLETAPVAGDTVAINDEWSLVIKEIDSKGTLRTIGLKHLERT